MNSLAIVLFCCLKTVCVHICSVDVVAQVKNSRRDETRKKGFPTVSAVRGHKRFDLNDVPSLGNNVGFVAGQPGLTLAGMTPSVIRYR